jgi:hypothetical protein
VVLVGGEQLLALRVGLEVEVAVGQAGAALQDVGDVDVGALGVGLDDEVEQRAAAAEEGPCSLPTVL